MEIRPAVTFAEHIMVCAVCREPYSYIVVDQDGTTHLEPCGHGAAITLIPNPRLGQEDS